MVKDATRVFLMQRIRKRHQTIRTRESENEQEDLLRELLARRFGVLWSQECCQAG